MASIADSPDLLLAEELLLLVLDDDKGHVTSRGTDSGLAGALLLDLVCGERLDLVDGRLVAAARPPADPAAAVLADALAAIQAGGEPREARHWVRKLPNELRPIKGSVARRLVERGVLSEQRRKVLGLVPMDVYAQADPEPERTLRSRLRAELTGEREVSARTALLVPLLRAHGLVAKLVGKDERKGAERRAKEIAEDPGKVGAAVRATLADAMVAVYVSVGLAVAVSAVGGGGDGGGGDSGSG